MAPKRFRLLNPESSRWYVPFVLSLLVPGALLTVISAHRFTFSEFGRLDGLAILLAVLLIAATLFSMPVARKSQTSEFAFSFPVFFGLIVLGFPFLALLTNATTRVVKDIWNRKPVATVIYDIGGTAIEILGLALFIKAAHLYRIPGDSSLGILFLFKTIAAYGVFTAINIGSSTPAIALVNGISLRAATAIDSVFELSVALVLSFSAAAMTGLAITNAALLPAFVAVATVGAINSALAFRRLNVSRTDQLTKLPNRRAMEDQVPEILSRARRRDRLVGIGVIDLDGFKLVNDSLGHEAGDKLLKTLSARVKAMSELGDNDFFGRLGGDEFVLVATESRHGRVLEIVRAVTSVLSLPVDIDGETVSVGASIGLAFAPDEGGRLGELLNNADRQMYAKKFERKAAQALGQEQSIRN